MPHKLFVPQASTEMWLLILLELRKDTEWTDKWVNLKPHKCVGVWSGQARNYKLKNCKARFSVMSAFVHASFLFKKGRGRDWFPVLPFLAWHVTMDDRRNTTGVLKELARNPLFEIFHTFCLSLRRPFFVFFCRNFIKTKTNFSENLASTSYAETPHPRPRLGFPLETHNASWVWLSKPLKWRKETAFSPKSFVERFLLNSFTRMNKYVILI